MKLKTYLKKDLYLIAGLLRSNGVILALIILSYFATYALNIYLANLLKPVLYGDVSIVFQLLMFSLPFALIGTELSMMHYLPKYFEEKDYEHASGFLRWNLRLLVWATIFILLLGAIIAVFALILERFGYHNIETYHIILFSFWLIPLFAFIVWLATILQTLRRYYWAASFRGFAVSFMIILTIVIFLSLFENSWIGAYKRVWSILLCIGIAYFVIILIEILTIYYKLPHEIYHVEPKFLKKNWFKHSFEMLGSFVGYTALAAIEIMLIEVVGENESMVGHFASIIVIGSSVMVFALAVDIFVNPHISSLVHKNKVHLQSILDIVNLFKLIPGLIISLFILFFGQWLLEHFGKGFEGAYPALLILLVGYLAGLALGSAMPVLIYSGHHILNFKISLWQLAVITLLSLILIPLFGIEGAALSLSLTILFSGVLRSIFVRKYLDINIFFFV
ncbi:MAG: polysaccharide biosynthesis C-terminal domain-containing protein [Simkaniaceae bacterium]